MDIKDVERIEGLISKAEIENAKSEAMIQNIKDNWKKNYGTDDVNEIKSKLNSFISEQRKTQEKMNVLFDELSNCCDWDELDRKMGF